MFGPKPDHVLIFRKTKTWWENMKKIHVPEYREKYSRGELIELVKQNQLIRMEVKKMQILTRVPLSEMIDFQKLTKCFFRDHPYLYGKYVEQEPNKNGNKKSVNSD